MHLDYAKYPLCQINVMANNLMPNAHMLILYRVAVMPTGAMSDTESSTAGCYMTDSTQIMDKSLKCQTFSCQTDRFFFHLGIDDHENINDFNKYVLSLA